MVEEPVLVDARRLRAFVSDAFRRAGLTAAAADRAGAALVQTDLWGKSSHGVMRLPHYVSRITSGAVNPRPAMRVVRGNGAFRVIDGDDGLGLLVGREAMSQAVRLAQEFDVGVVGAIRSNHFGAAALYARYAVDRGMVGVAMTNTAPKVIAPGGTRPVTGSNPLAIGVPSHGAFPFLLDLSMSTVAGGRLLLAREAGEKIPLGWAVDGDGAPTDDPDEAFRGSWLPAGGVKGLGLSYAVDVLSGVITGASFGLGMRSQYGHAAEPSHTGHLMVALRLDAIIERHELERRMQEYFRGIKDSPVRDPQAEMLVPGETAYRQERQRRLRGIPIPAGVLAGLVSLGRELGTTVALVPSGQEAGR